MSSLVQLYDAGTPFTITWFFSWGCGTSCNVHHGSVKVQHAKVTKKKYKYVCIWLWFGCSQMQRYCLKWSQSWLFKAERKLHLKWHNHEQQLFNIEKSLPVNTLIMSSGIPHDARIVCVSWSAMTRRTELILNNWKWKLERHEMNDWTTSLRMTAVCSVSVPGEEGRALMELARYRVQKSQVLMMAASAKALLLEIHCKRWRELVWLVYSSMSTLQSLTKTSSRCMMRMEIEECRTDFNVPRWLYKI